MKYCDLVMKGGITSGIVYPNAVLALSKDHRFKNIGGTSAGAIAAAASAAAALGDRRKQAGEGVAHDEAKIGFEGLKDVAETLSRRGFIYGLFQPAWGARNAYRLIVVLAGKGGAGRKALALFLAVFAIAPVESLLLFAALSGIGYAIDGWRGAWSAAVPAVVCAYMGGAVCAVLRIARVARRNLLGLCNGLGRSPFRGKARPALTEWLHEILQQLSGKPLDEPLTFGDLWNAPRYPDEPETPRALTLQMITTDVSHHEPRTLPFEQGAFWFRREEFAMLFPPVVVDWLAARAGEPVCVAQRSYYRLPEGGDLPVLVAMRMSLSFPLLISAVPLHEPATRQRATVPAEEGADGGAGADAPTTLLQSTESLASGGRSPAADIRDFRICWFSDGGISSNFPIHLFDAPLPVWPTFAIDLVYPDTDDAPADGQPAVWLPGGNNAGWQRSYQPIAEPIAVRELAGFLFGIVATMQNWRDLLLSRAPGQRDRIVHVALASDEGGMNLNMPQAMLDRISAKGTAAGLAFEEFSFANHYWVRWRNLASALQRFAIGTAGSLHSHPPIAEYADIYATATTGTPPPPSYRFQSQDRAAAAEQLLDCLSTKGQEWEDLGPDLTTGAPRPLPQLQVMPIY